VGGGDEKNSNARKKKKPAATWSDQKGTSKSYVAGTFNKLRNMGTWGIRAKKKTKKKSSWKNKSFKNPWERDFCEKITTL